MGSAEFTEWMAFYLTEPWGEQRSDIQHAMLMTLLANANRDPKRKAFQASEFMPDYWRAEPEEPTAQTLIQKFKAATKQP